MNEDKKLNKKTILASVAKVLDPELGISLVDLGLIYDVKVTKTGKVKVVMTLTSIGCPLFEVMADDIKREINKIKGVKEVEIELTFDPPWSIDKMSERARVQLGLE